MFSEFAQPIPEDISSDNLDKDQDKQELKITLKDCEILISSIKGLRNIFEQRNKARLVPLIDGENYNRMGVASSQIESTVQSENFDIQEFNQQLRALKVAIDSIGSIQAQAVNENMQALDVVNHHLGRVQESCGILLESMSHNESEQKKETSKLVRDLFDSAQNRWDFIGSKKEILERYLRG